MSSAPIAFAILFVVIVRTKRKVKFKINDFIWGRVTRPAYNSFTTRFFILLYVPICFKYPIHQQKFIFFLKSLNFVNYTASFPPA